MHQKIEKKREKKNPKAKEIDLEKIARTQKTYEKKQA